jgi:formylglycine-generating enzyme required for sulfatase activity
MKPVVAFLSVLFATCSIERASAQSGHPASSDRVTIGAFAIDRAEVSIGRFRAFVAAKAQSTAAERDGGGFEFVGGWTRRSGWTWAAPYGQPGSDTEPVVHISWAEARDYCSYAKGRLPTFAEWREAAYTETRNDPTDGLVKGRTYRYPAGDAPDGMNVSSRRHLAVGASKPGVNGLYDMGGNVWEWMADRRGDEALTAGGSWWYDPSHTEVSSTQWKPAEFYAVYVGFRCAYDV